ncbi:S-adenosyl-L-methionine-dependent methyltransferase [Aspergillus ambiguus]|uniref:S-adenosyl-L-methionine-dependent methyltransferase n=1 Tax=Aspergillus ambiguus TaxID=176160 RepID=UPI003CCD8E79
MKALKQLDIIQKILLAEESENYTTHQQLLEEVRRLQRAVETPIDTMKRITMQMVQNIVVRIAIEKRWLQIVASANGTPVRPLEIAAETKDDPTFITRILRFLAVIGLCDENVQGKYTANERTLFFVQSGSIAAVKATYDLFFPMAGRLVDYMQGPGLPAATGKLEESLSRFTYGTNHVFDMMETKPELKKSFDEYMFAEQQWFPFAWFEIYPPAEKLGNSEFEPSHPLIVDIAGGHGQNLIHFKEHYPNHSGRLILQDLPSTIEGTPRLPDGIEAMGHDCFTPQPVQGASIYMFRHIIHDWSDSEAEHIFRQIVPAMDPEQSTLLIVDRVMPEHEPELRDVELDLLMWLAVNGLERTESQWSKLFQKAGLKLTRVWRSPRLGDCVLEAKIALHG